MVFVAAGYDDVVANDLAVSLKDGNELPVLVDEDFLEDVDALGVTSGPCHKSSLPGGEKGRAGGKLGQMGEMDTTVDTMQRK